MSDWEQATVLTRTYLSISKNRGLFLKLPGLFQFSNGILPRKNGLKTHQHRQETKTAIRRPPLGSQFHLAWVRLSSSKRMKEDTSTPLYRMKTNWIYLVRALLKQSIPFIYLSYKPVIYGVAENNKRSGMETKNFDRLVGLIYDAALEPALWRDALDELACQVGRTPGICWGGMRKWASIHWV